MFLLIRSKIQGLTSSALTAQQTSGGQWMVQDPNVRYRPSDFLLATRSKLTTDQVIPAPPLASFQPLILDTAFTSWDTATIAHIPPTS